MPGRQQIRRSFENLSHTSRIVCDPDIVSGIHRETNRHTNSSSGDIDTTRRTRRCSFGNLGHTAHDMGYTMINVGEGTGGGMWKNPDNPSQWLAYVLVNDINASTKKAKSLGAKVSKEVTEIPGMGWLSIIIDPTGATLGLWQTKKGM